MLAFLWCGLAFYAVYLGTRIRWQHGWEYGSACILIAGAYAYYMTRLSNPDDKLARPPAIDRMARIAGYQAVLIGIGLVWLIGAGKLITHKGDWAANHLFLAGGVHDHVHQRLAHQNERRTERAADDRLTNALALATRAIERRAARMHRAA